MSPNNKRVPQTVFMAFIGMVLGMLAWLALAEQSRKIRQLTGDSIIYQQQLDILDSRCKTLGLRFDMAVDLLETYGDIIDSWQDQVDGVYILQKPNKLPINDLSNRT